MSRYATKVTEGKSPRNVGPGQKVTTSTTSAQSTAVAEGVNEVDLIANTPTYIEVGANPTATVDTSYRIPAETIVRLPLYPGDKIAAVAGTSGNLWIHPVA